MKKMDKNIKDLNLNLQDIDEDWNKVNKILMETAEQEIGSMKKKIMNGLMRCVGKRFNSGNYRE